MLIKFRYTLPDWPNTEYKAEFEAELPIPLMIKNHLLKQRVGEVNITHYEVIDEKDKRIAELEALLRNFHRNTTPTDKQLTVGQYEFKIATIHGLAGEALEGEVK